MSGKLGEILLKENLITPEQLKQSIDHQKANGGRLGTSIVKLGFLNDDEVTAVLSLQYGVPSFNFAYFDINPTITKLIPMDTAMKYQVLPLSLEKSTLMLAMVDPTNTFAMDDIKFMTGFTIEPVVASEAAIMEAIKKYYGSVEDQERKNELEEIVNFIDEGLTESLEPEDLEQLEKAAEEAPVIKLVNYILVDAVKRRASDIYLEPFEREYRVRYRIDGMLQTVMNPPLKLRDAIISRVKIMSKLNFLEKRKPQKGRMQIRVIKDGKKKQVDFRIYAMPALHGERIVLRVLDKENLRLDMTKLGFEQISLDKFTKAIFKPYGMVLVTGPTGSGKTATLYSTMSQLNKPDTSIVSIEDSMEFSMHGITQVQVNEQTGLTVASALSSVEEQGPDVIMVGEIRDSETAQLALLAARRGHLILSSMPTDDAPSAISLLVNMGIKPFLVAGSVSLVCAQRLVRRICPDCKVPEAIAPQVLIDAGFTPEEAQTVQAYRGEGCAACNNTGYRGRVGLFEVMEMTDELRALIEGGASLADPRRKAEEQGMMTLRRSGLIKVADGVTTLDEVLLQTLA